MLKDKVQIEWWGGNVPWSAGGGKWEELPTERLLGETELRPQPWRQQQTQGTGGPWSLSPGQGGTPRSPSSLHSTPWGRAAATELREFLG